MAAHSEHGQVEPFQPWNWGSGGFMALLLETDSLYGLFGWLSPGVRLWLFITRSQDAPVQWQETCVQLSTRRGYCYVGETG